MTQHARDRCAEMGISTKVAKRILQYPAVDWPSVGEQPCRIAVSDRHPEYAVVYQDDGDGLQWVLTVVFRTPITYQRAGSTYRPV